MRIGWLPSIGVLLALGAAAVPGCRSESGSEDPSAAAGIDLLDPESCRGCHEEQSRSWSGSMHAYASDDPVFRAMNARGLRETGGRLGDFCVRCHAPVAFALGATVDGTNLDALAPRLRGVTCFACHAAEDVAAEHGGVRLAIDGPLRGGIVDPIAGAPHAAAHSTLHDRTRAESASLCGGCHDVRGSTGALLEGTFTEWSGSRFADAASDDPRTCGGCHMPAHDGVAALVPGAPIRRVHDHTMAGVDVALGPFPERDAQRIAVQSSLAGALRASLCVREAGKVEVSVENARAGHAWPSGAAHNRRAALEVTAYAAGQRVWSSEELLHATLVDGAGAPVKFLWEAAGVNARSIAPPGAPPRTLAFDVPTPFDRIAIRVAIAPFAPDLLAALVASGDLDPARVADVPVFSLAATELEWSAERGFGCLP